MISFLLTSTIQHDHVRRCHVPVAGGPGLSNVQRADADAEPAPSTGAQARRRRGWLLISSRPIQWGVYLHVVMGIFTTMPSLVLSSCLGTHHLSLPFFFPFGQLAPACTDVIEHIDVCSRACVCATAGGGHSSHRLCEHVLSQIIIE